MRTVILILVVLGFATLFFMTVEEFLNEGPTTQLTSVPHDYVPPEAQAMEAMRTAKRTNGAACFHVKGHADLTGKYCIEFSPR